MATAHVHVLAFLSFFGLEADALAGTRSAALASNEQRQAPCVWNAPAECATQWSFNGAAYSGCSTESNNAQGWCSHDVAYSGEWSNCNCAGAVVVSSPASNSTMLNDKSASPFAAGWAPTEEEDAYLKAQAEVAQQNRLAVQVKHKQLLTEATTAQKEFEDAARVEAIAKKKSSIAEKIRVDEEQRIRALPVLVEMAQQEALAQHAKRMELEKQVQVARETREASAKIQEEGLKAVEREINKQRLIDRIRAAEDARIANAAETAANEAAAEKKIKDADIAAVLSIAETANEESQVAVTGAHRTIMDATMAMSKEVMEATSSASMIDVRVAEAKRALKDLSARAQRSASLAQDAKKQAYIDRARADATSLGAGAVSTFAGGAQRGALVASNAAQAFDARAAAARTQAEAATKALTDARSAASTSATAAAADLTATAMTLGKSEGESEQQDLLARTEPERYLAGFVSEFAGGLNGL